MIILLLQRNPGDEEVHFSSVQEWMPVQSLNLDGFERKFLRITCCIHMKKGNNYQKKKKTHMKKGNSVKLLY